MLPFATTEKKKGPDSVATFLAARCYLVSASHLMIPYCRFSLWNKHGEGKKKDRGFWKQADVFIRRSAKNGKAGLSATTKNNWTYVCKLKGCGLIHLSVQGKRRGKKSLRERSHLWTDCGKNAEYCWYEKRLMSERVCFAPNDFLSSFIWLPFCSIGCYRLIIWKHPFKKGYWR